MQTITATKERPILFKGEMIRAILNGSKTQTRRIIKPQPDSIRKGHNPCTHSDVLEVDEFGDLQDITLVTPIKCPYGQVGDVLWVRETMVKNLNSNTYWPVADGYHPSINEQTNKREVYQKVIPSIHMPREACRLRLEITDIRVERLQDISEDDAIAEGVEKYTEGSYKNYLFKSPEMNKAKFSFQSLWDSINGPDSWNADPYVWVVEFKPL